MVKCLHLENSIFFICSTNCINTSLLSLKMTPKKETIKSFSRMHIISLDYNMQLEVGAWLFLAAHLVKWTLNNRRTPVSVESHNYRTELRKPHKERWEERRCLQLDEPGPSHHGTCLERELGRGFHRVPRQKQLLAWTTNICSFNTILVEGTC